MLVSGGPQVLVSIRPLARPRSPDPAANPTAHNAARRTALTALRARVARRGSKQKDSSKREGFALPFRTEAAAFARPTPLDSRSRRAHAPARGRAERLLRPQPPDRLRRTVEGRHRHGRRPRRRALPLRRAARRGARHRFVARLRVRGGPPPGRPLRGVRARELRRAPRAPGRLRARARRARLPGRPFRGERAPRRGARPAAQLLPAVDGLARATALPPLRRGGSVR